MCMCIANQSCINTRRKCMLLLCKKGPVVAVSATCNPANMSMASQFRPPSGAQRHGRYIPDVQTTTHALRHPLGAFFSNFDRHGTGSIFVVGEC